MKLVKTGWLFIRNYKIKALIYIILTLLFSIIGLVLPVLLGGFINFIIDGKTIDGMLNYIYLYASLCLLNILVKYISGFLYCEVQAKSANDYNCSIIKEIHKKKYSIIRDIDPVYYTQRINNDCNTIIIFCLSLVQNIISNILNLIIPLIVIFTINQSLFLIVLSLSIIYFIMYRVLRMKLFNLNNLMINQKNEYFSDLNKQLDKIKIITLNLMSNKLMTKLKISFEKVYTSIIKFFKYSNLMTALDGIASALGQIIILIFCGYLIIDNSMNVGTFTIINTYYAMLISSVSYFFNFGKSFQEANAAYSRIKGIEQIPLMEYGDLKIHNQIEEIRIENLTFNYDKAEIINNLSIEFKLGKLYCIYGRNGKGKTTLIDIISGLYNNEYSGHIKINDYELNDIDIIDYKVNHLSVCDQDTTFILETVYDELELYNVSIPEMKECLNDLKIDDNICYGLYNLFNHLLKANKASNQLSRGEQQILSIFKVFLSNKDLLIFDEPSSALDENNIKIFLALVHLFKNNKIIIVISHDDRVLKQCDEIIKL